MARFLVKSSPRLQKVLGFSQPRYKVSSLFIISSTRRPVGGTSFEYAGEQPATFAEAERY